MLIRDRLITAITIDPNWEMADVDSTNNKWSETLVPARLELIKEDAERNMMEEMQQ
jgi:hypothetical protein